MSHAIADVLTGEPWGLAPLAHEPPRIRFVALRADRSAAGRCRAEVTLARLDGTLVTGALDEAPCALSPLRVAAGATVGALHQATTTGHRFELTAVRAVRAFDDQVVLVQLAVLGGRGPSRLVGCAFAGEDPARAAALAVLNATNRLLWTPAAAGDTPR